MLSESVWSWSRFRRCWNSFRRFFDGTWRRGEQPPFKFATDVVCGRCCTLLLTDWWSPIQKAWTRVVFNWLSKNLDLSNYSDQSQHKQTARFANQNPWQFPVNCSKGGKNRTYKVRLVFYFASHWLKNSREIFKRINKLSRNYFRYSFENCSMYMYRLVILDLT